MDTNMLKRSIKIAVIGCGHWGKNLVRNFAELGVLEAVCDANMELAHKLGSNHGVDVKSFSDILASSVEGVVIAAPAVQHYTLAKQALEANKHVFVEKPLSLKVEEAQELCVLAHNKNKILTLQLE